MQFTGVVIPWHYLSSILFVLFNQLLQILLCSTLVHLTPKSPHCLIANAVDFPLHGSCMPTCSFPGMEGRIGTLATVSLLLISSIKLVCFFLSTSENIWQNARCVYISVTIPVTNLQHCSLHFPHSVISTFNSLQFDYHLSHCKWCVLYIL